MTAALWVLLGLAGGALHFALLRWNTRLYVEGSGIAQALALQTMRLAATALLLLFAATHGAMPLLLAALGVALARPLVLRIVAPAP